jgi:hypothetical protein
MCFHLDLGIDKKEIELRIREKLTSVPGRNASFWICTIEGTIYQSKNL